MTFLNRAEFNPFNKRLEDIKSEAEKNPEGDLEAQFDKPAEGYVDRQPDDTDVIEDPFGRPDYNKTNEQN
jgi:hypothetical protein